MHQPYNVSIQANHSKGFTLVEMIVVITVIGVVAAGAALFIRNPTQAYFDLETRAGLTDLADGTMRKMARDVQLALPNSVRVTQSGSDYLLEFIPIIQAGRYRAAVGTSGTDDPLDFTATADTFDVLGPQVTVASGNQLVIYNLGITGADAYEGSNRRNILSAGTVSNVSFNGGTFPLASPSSRFYVVTTPITYACDMTNGKLWRYSGYTIQTSQPATLASMNALVTPNLMASNLSYCKITYTAGNTQRTAVVNIALGFTDGGANVRLMQQMSVINSP